MNNKGTLRVALPLFFALVVLLLSLTLKDDYPARAWIGTTTTACAEGIFGIPETPLPQFILDGLGERGAGAASIRRDLLEVSISELTSKAFPEVGVNLNCARSPYDAEMLNIYILKQPDPRFSFAEGTVTVKSDVEGVIVFGADFWRFFLAAWEPIVGLKDGVTHPDFLSAHADFSLELYDFYVEWILAHELGHLKLGHVGDRRQLSRNQMEIIESEADVFAAQLLVDNYSQITPQLLGLIQEWMRLGFERTYGRPWEPSDGAAFELSWESREQAVTSGSWMIVAEYEVVHGHPPFLFRVISMTEAIARMKTERFDDAWSRSVIKLVEDLRRRIVEDRSSITLTSGSKQP